MKRGPISRRLEAALEKTRRNDPDGPLASYSFMWRALVRSSPSRVGVILRFTSLVLVDAVLLLGWSVARPVRVFFRSRLRQAAIALGIAAAAALMLGSPLSSPSPPWDGSPTLSIEPSGLLRFEGQVVADAEAVRILRHYDVQQASIDANFEVTYKRLTEVVDLLVDAGIGRIVLSPWRGPETKR